MKILLILFLLFSCKETINNCLKTKTIVWNYTLPNHKIGFKIYSGHVYPSDVIATIPLSVNPPQRISHQFDVCVANYVAVSSFDDAGNESVLSPVTCIGVGCKPMNYTQSSVRPPAPRLE